MSSKKSTSVGGLVLGILALALPILVCAILYLIKTYVISFYDYDMWDTSYAQYALAVGIIGGIYIALILIRSFLKHRTPAMVFGIIEIIAHLVVVVVSYVMVTYKCGFSIWVGLVATGFHFSFWSYNPLDDDFDRMEAFGFFKFVAIASVPIGLVMVLAFLGGVEFLIPKNVELVIHIVLTAIGNILLLIFSISRSLELFRDGEGSDIVHGDYYMLEKYTINYLTKAITDYYNDSIQAINAITKEIHQDYYLNYKSQSYYDEYIKVKDEWVSDLEDEYDKMERFINRIAKCKFPESMDGHKYVFDFNDLSRNYEDYHGSEGFTATFVGFSRKYSYDNYYPKSVSLKVSSVSAFFDGPYNDDKKE